MAARAGGPGAPEPGRARLDRAMADVESRLAALADGGCETGGGARPGPSPPSPG